MREIISFQTKSRFLNLISSNSQNVQVVHTDGSILGMMSAIGHSDFYVNFGKTQPGCGSSMCNHSRAYLYFVESILNNRFMANKCANYYEITTGNCTIQATGLIMGGEPPSYGLTGVFVLSTNGRSPFGRG